jgi:LacI family transcriptional regulator
MVKQTRTVTIRDVAAAARVNASTVSRVLRKDGPGVSLTAQRVFQAAADLGYEPNLVARALTNQSFPIVPLLIPDMRNSFFSEVAWGAEEAARDAGYYLVLCNTEGRIEAERRYLQSFRRIHVPFVVAAPTSLQSVEVLREYAAKMPMVIIDQFFEDLEAVSVTTDNAAGTASATGHLISLGHRNIVCIRGAADTWTAAQREAGYRDAMNRAGLSPRVIPGGFSRRSGRLAAMHFFSLDPVPTGAIAPNDYCAIGFSQEAKRRGVRIPEDVSLVGFDDLDLAAFSNPALTTIHQPATRLGRRAVEAALQQGSRRTDVQLRCRLIQRESTAPPRTTKMAPDRRRGAVDS